MSLEFTILGCGSSSGVPRITGDWNQCDPNEPKNRRRRCAILITKTSNAGKTRILVDTGPDIHHQLLETNTSMLDAVLITHEHADHTHGIDDLRAFAQDSAKQMPVHMTAQTYLDVGAKFSYCFKQVEGSGYPAILRYEQIEYDQPVVIDGAGGAIEILPVRLTHGGIEAAGFLINGVMYSPDVSAIPDASLYAFENLAIWIIDCLRPRPHFSHFGLDDSLAWIEKLQPKRAILTNMTGEFDYQTLKASLAQKNQDIIPAYDGMCFDV